MKKTAAILTAILLAITFAAADEPIRTAEIFETAGEVLTVRVPEGKKTYFSFFSGDYTMEPLTDGGTVNGVTSASYVLPEAARGESQLFIVTVDLSDGKMTDVRAALYCTLENGELYCLGYSQKTADFFADWSEGYEYSDGRTLQITLPGSPATGYEWTMIPDNSGILELADCYEIDERENEEDPLKTSTGFFFIPVKNPAGNEGSLIFMLDRAPEGEASGKTLEFGFALNEDGQVADVMRIN